MTRQQNGMRGVRCADHCGTRTRIGKPRACAWGSDKRWMCNVTLVVFVVGLTLRGVGPTYQSVANAAPAGDALKKDAPPDPKADPTRTDQAKPGPTKSDKELGERLIRQVHGDTDDDVMDTILRLMASASQQLEIEFDAGEETQTLQRQVIEQLNAAIKMAGRRRRTRSQDQQLSRGDKRRRGDDKSRLSDKQNGSDELEQEPTSPKTTDAGELRREGARDGGSLFESRRTWGQLPLREREEVIQGISERHLERFRAWIERYYRALQESDDSNPR